MEDHSQMLQILSPKLKHFLELKYNKMKIRVDSVYDLLLSRHGDERRGELFALFAVNDGEWLNC
jgi:hypothetical protein